MIKKLFLIPMIFSFACIQSMNVDKPMSANALAETVEGLINHMSGQEDGGFCPESFVPNVDLIVLKNSSKEIMYRFFMVHSDNQKKVNYSEFKKKLLQELGMKTSAMTEFVGDSNQFSSTGTSYTRDILNPFFEKGLLEYGFTGYGYDHAVERDGKKHDRHELLDINSFVNVYVEEHPEEAYRVLANVLGHTTSALKHWGCTVNPHVRNFVVVYNSDGMKKPEYEGGLKVSGMTTFGDDVTVSDYILSAQDDDTFVLVEGGAQSFIQAVNALENDVKVSAVYGVREPKERAFFSATEFFLHVKKALEGNPKLTIKEVEALYDEYALDHEPWKSDRHDSKTKGELFFPAKDAFIQGGLYKKLLTHVSFVEESGDK